MTGRLSARTTGRVALAAAAVATTVLAGFAVPSTATAAGIDPLPVITSLSVTSGPQQGTTDLRIHGENFDPTDTVTMGGKTATFIRATSAHIEVWAPAHAAGTVQVRVTTQTGTSATSTASQYHYFAPAKRSAPELTALKSPPKPTDGGTITPSCPTADFCVAADGFGNVTYFDGTSWSGAHRIDTVPVTLSCPTTTFCVAVDIKGRQLRYNGSTWTSPKSIGTFKIASLSCASPSLCLVITRSSGNYLAYNGTSWTAPAPIPDVPEGLVARASSCGGDRCLVGTSANSSQSAELMTFDGSTWADVGPYLGPNGDGNRPSVVGISCPTAQFCAVSDDQLQVSLIDGATLTDTQVLGAYTASPVDLSCASSTFCLYMDQDPNEDDNTFVDVYDGTNWATAKGWEYDDGSIYLNVSCGADKSCFIGSYSSVARYADGLVGFIHVLPAVSLTEVSCASATMCVATDRHGDAAVYKARTWRRAQPLSHDGKDATSHVSCPTTTFCAFSNGARVRFYDGKAWHSNPLIDDQELFGISCGSPKLCAAIDRVGRVVMFNGKRWSAPHAIVEPKRELISVSCAGTAICAAADAQGGVEIYRNGTWSSRHKEFDDPGQHDELNLAGEVSCGGSKLCVLADNVDGTVGVYDGHHWQAPVAVPYSPSHTPAPGLSHVQCASGSFCLVQDSYGQIYTFNTTKWSVRHSASGQVFTCLSSRECLIR